MSMQRLANLIATAVAQANSTIGMAERATVQGDTVVTNHGAYQYEACCPINLYDGKTVWVQIADGGGVAVIIGE